MPIQTAEKIYKEVKALRQETNTLKELFFLILKDYEGEYKNSFIKRVLRESNSKPQFIFTNKKKFIKQIS